MRRSQNAFARGARTGVRSTRRPEAGSIVASTSAGEDRVTVVEEEPVGVVARDRLAQLLRDPGGRRVVGDIDVEDAAAADLHGHEDVEHVEAGGHRR